jgi:hypothetical protein
VKAHTLKVLILQERGLKVVIEKKEKALLGQKPGSAFLFTGGVLIL